VSPALLPRASLRDVVRGRAPLVGARIDPRARRGFVSPIEARLDLGVLYGDATIAERDALERRSLSSDAATLAKTCVARALGGGDRSERAAKRPFIVSSRVDNVTIREALELVFQAPSNGQGRFIAFAHPHALNLARFDAGLRQRLAEADAVLPDGVGLRIAGRITGAPLVANVNGTDLLPLVCEEAARRGTKLALVGAKDGVAERAAHNLRDGYPGLQIPLVSHGYLDEPATKEILDRVRALGRVVVLVGMGSPAQERWCHAARALAPEATFVTVGGLFDFFSGDVPRAPLAVRELGLEWAFRMAQEPRRLGKRYLVGNPLFLGLAVLSRLGAPK
jgi:N-acetylglucosaminyldiphosphoundecaprenol N-acetyl-beta-D-mannosaminyltransferase